MRCAAPLQILAFAGLLACPALAEPPAPAELLALRLDADARYAARDTAAIELYRRLLAVTPADGELLRRLTRMLAIARRDEEAAVVGRQALEAGFAVRERACYTLAAQAARAGRRAEALEWIERALAAPLEDRPRLQEDTDFASLRDDPRFRELAGLPPGGEASREQGWRFDLDFFLAEARRLHAAPDRRAHAPALERDVRALQARLGELDDPGVAIELQKLVVRHLADGHSVVYPMPTPRVRFGMLPVQLYFFSDGLHVVGAGAGHERLVGRRVTAINGKPVDRIVDDLRAVVSRDNDYSLLWIGPVYLQSPAVLRAIGYGAALDHATLTLAGGRRPETVRLEAGGHPPHQSLVPPPGVAPPRWLARGADPYWSEPLPAARALYAQVNQIGDADRGPTLAEFAAGLRDQLERTGSRHLILDLRLNNGGNNALTPPLVRLVAWHETESAEHRTWVLTGRNTFSACQNLVNRLEATTRAVFLGEPAGSRPNMVGENTDVRLPWSGLRLSISSRYFQDSEPRDERPYVPVALHLPLSSADWRAAKDPVMEALLEHLARR